MRLLISASILAFIACPAFAQQNLEPSNDLLTVRRDSRIAACNADTLTVTAEGATLSSATKGTQCPNVTSVNQTGGVITCSVEAVTTSPQGTVVNGTSATGCEGMNVISVNQTGGITAGYIGTVNETSAAPKPKY